MFVTITVKTPNFSIRWYVRSVWIPTLRLVMTLVSATKARDVGPSASILLLRTILPIISACLVCVVKPCIIVTILSWLCVWVVVVVVLVRLWSSVVSSLAIDMTVISVIVY